MLIKYVKYGPDNMYTIVELQIPKYSNCLKKKSKKQ